MAAGLDAIREDVGERDDADALGRLEGVYRRTRSAAAAADESHADRVRLAGAGGATHQPARRERPRGLRRRGDE
jgi:hypothetical protein